jgi:hypothetical protein
LIPVVSVAVHVAPVESGKSDVNVTVLPETETRPGTFVPPTARVKVVVFAVGTSMGAEKFALNLVTIDTLEAPAVGVVEETVIAFDGVGAVGEDFLLHDGTVAKRSNSSTMRPVMTFLL